eukprot:Blabericola_migrator_1__6381@NODE_3216_length_1942_cov_14_068800_g2013_i0_p3_GENE_NODE_3216_length_1942_cov_14_068800_g2013_i0NODE_3216_length_1942_cov_14_068800_g2013_i0_p3_ORF_typecomplete_len105_score6_66_NODE_3216_length_1942_cov_14_068800_g2013_i016211935
MVILRVLLLTRLAFAAPEAELRNLRRPAQVPIPENMYPPPDRFPLPLPSPVKSRPEGYWSKGVYGGSFGSYIMGFAGLPPTRPLASARRPAENFYPAAYGALYV